MYKKAWKKTKITPMETTKHTLLNVQLLHYSIFLKVRHDELIHNLIIMNDHDVNRRQKQSALEEWKRVWNASAREGGERS